MIFNFLRPPVPQYEPTNYPHKLIHHQVGLFNDHPFHQGIKWSSQQEQMLFFYDQKEKQFFINNDQNSNQLIKAKNGQETILKYRDYYDQTVLEVLNSLKGFAKGLLDQYPDDPPLLPDEVKDYEWLKVTLKVLKEAIEKTKSDKELLTEYRIEWNINKKTLYIEALSLVFKVDLNDKLDMFVWDKKDKTQDVSQYNLGFQSYLPKVIDELTFLFQLLRPSTEE
jgi:hypothetical protein